MSGIQRPIPKLEDMIQFLENDIDKFILPNLWSVYHRIEILEKKGRCDDHNFGWAGSFDHYLQRCCKWLLPGSKWKDAKGITHKDVVTCQWMGRHLNLQKLFLGSLLQNNLQQDQ